MDYRRLSVFELKYSQRVVVGCFIPMKMNNGILPRADSATDVQSWTRQFVGERGLPGMGLARSATKGDGCWLPRADLATGVSAVGGIGFGHGRVR